MVVSRGGVVILRRGWRVLDGKWVDLSDGSKRFEWLGWCAIRKYAIICHLRSFDWILQKRITFNNYSLRAR